MNARLGTRFAPIKAVSRPRDAIHPKTIHQTHGDTMKNHFTPFASDANAKTVSASLSHPSTAALSNKGLSGEFEVRIRSNPGSAG